MARKNMKEALADSLKAEDVAFKTRLEKADALFGERAEPESPPPVPSIAGEEKPKVIRDSFTLPASDYDLIAALKKRCLESAINVNKSELVRAGLHALNAMTESELAQIIESLEKVKTGRPTSKA